MNNVSEKFGKRLRSLRVSKKMSQEKLAEMSELHATYIGQIERGEKNPTVETVYKLSNGLGILPDEFFRNNSNSENFSVVNQIYNDILSLSAEKQRKLCEIINSIMNFN